jgi:hypothetical protein
MFLAGFTRTASLLVKHAKDGEVVSRQNNEGKTPLHLAAGRGENNGFVLTTLSHIGCMYVYVKDNNFLCTWHTGIPKIVFTMYSFSIEKKLSRIECYQAVV